MKTEYPYITKRGNKAKKSDLEFLPLNFEPFADEVNVDSEIDHKISVDKFLSVLDDREREIILLRFFYDKTLDDVGLSFNISRDRVRQLEGRALRKMRYPLVAKKFGETPNVNWMKNL